DVEFLIPSQLEEQYTKEGKEIPKPIKVKAQIDTGASHSVVQEDIPKKLGLRPVGQITVNTPSTTSHPCYQYFIRMFIPQMNISYEGLFTALPLGSQTPNCLIGRNMLQYGVFIYNGAANQFTLCLL
ncbi:MAG: hypothetical protein HY520_02215, partial [Candidatus Aenigmarchaeota archaeon]|nr:hypothetical protein [Candidatus Aenigmarchaeota archaeon]